MASTDYFGMISLGQTEDIVLEPKGKNEAAKKKVIAEIMREGYDFKDSILMIK